MSRYLEHANMTVNDLEKAIDFLTTAFQISSQGRWVRTRTERNGVTLGTDDFTLPCQTASSRSQVTVRGDM